MCHDCHTSHTFSRTDQEGFKLLIISQCGRCHQEVTEGYFESFHGKVSKLGHTAAAKCYDCHGSHDVLPDWNPESRLSRQNIVATCGKCHPGSHRRFAGYLTHATHHDPDKYPILYYTFWAELEGRLAPPLPQPIVRLMKIFGAIALTTGIVLIVLIIWTEVFGYR